MKDPILSNEEVSFRMSIKRTAGNQVIFGVVNSVNRINERTSYNQGEGTCYYATNGYVYGPNNNQNSGFRANEEVVMTVNLSTPKVTWTVNGVLRATSTVNVLKNKNHMYVPYIEMYNCGDSV